MVSLFVKTALLVLLFLSGMELFSPLFTFHGVWSSAASSFIHVLAVSVALFSLSHFHCVLIFDPNFFGESSVLIFLLPAVLWVVF